MDEIQLSAAQLKCLASPACNDVLQALRAMGQASAREIAGRLNRSPATVHYHMKCLIDCGLVREAFRRPTKRKPEAVFELVSTRLRLPRVAPDSEEGVLARQAVAAGLRQVMRGYEKAAASPTVGRPPHVLRAQIRLQPADLERFLEMLEAASRFANEHRVEDAPLMHWSSVVYPEVL